MRRSGWMTWMAGGLILSAGMTEPRAASAAEEGLVLVDAGVSQAPIVVFEDAPPFTRGAAEELAGYIEKISGARPNVIEGVPDPVPAHAIWVGYQPALDTLFPDIDFDFQHPEEILIAANEKHVVIAGRDRWNPEHLKVSYLKPLGGRNPGGRGTVEVDGVQLEYGTANAVYTFLQDVLDVRWFWPGELGEDIIARETIAIAPMEYRYHPQIRGRAGIFFHSHMAMKVGHSQDWVRKQRLQLDSLWLQSWHPLSYWWKSYHETHPELFALQPDGTRSGWPGPRGAKFCRSNPAVWEQWMSYVARELKRYPNQTVFSAAANDGGAQGFCVCEACRAWDPPDGPKVRYIWNGASREMVGQADRQIRFANTVGRMLKQRYPDKDYYVSIMAYGNSRPAPVEAVPNDNVIVDLVFNFHNRKTLNWSGETAADQRRQFLAWTAKGFERLGWRPNLGGAAGWQMGMPNVAMQRAIDDIRFVAEHGIISVTFDTMWEHWANQGPYYYIMAQMAWNPYADGEAILADYYRRAFGPAAATMETYWTLMESSSDEIVFGEKPQDDVWNAAFYRQAYALLDRAAAAAKDAPAIYAERIGFARGGLEYMRLYDDTAKLIDRLRTSGGKDKQADAAARANWVRLDEIFTAYPHAFDPSYIGTPRGSGGLGRMRAIHPDYYTSDKSAVPAYEPTAKTNVTLQPAEESGWNLAFSDDFERDTLGDDWKEIGGIWALADGALRGAGAIALTHSFPADGNPAFQRLEFDVMTDLRPNAPDPADAVSDLSAVLHAKDADNEGDFLTSGYFFQFGWKMNKRTRIQRAGTPIVADNDPDTLIVPDCVHTMVMENDGGALRLFVDGKLVIAARETQTPLVGGGNDRIGLYFYTPVKVLDLKVYTKQFSGGPGME